MLQFPSATELMDRMDAAGHAVFRDDSRPCNLNIIAQRDPEPVLDRFGCILSVLWMARGQWFGFHYRITTFPGSYFLINRLLNRRGCAILKPGQYRGAYQIDLHRGKYRALCQRRAVTVYRDNDRDREFDMLPETHHKGLFGINIHRAGHSGKSPKVGRNSAGCQVFQEREDFDEFMRICAKARAHWGNRFTYTLLD